MAKVATYIIFGLGLMLLLNMAGIPTAIDNILAYFGLGINGQAVSTSTFAIAVGVLFAAAAITGIIVGFFTKSSPDSYIRATMAAALIFFVATFVSLINYSLAHHPVWVSSIIILILGPFSIGYLMALIDFWGGTG